jgi:sulfur carrier protein
MVTPAQRAPCRRLALARRAAPQPRVPLKKGFICGYLCSAVVICGEEAAMRVTINGEEKQVADGLTVAAMLQHLALPAERVALERNRDILPRALWAATAVQPGDTFEIVTLVGGG